MNDGFCPRCGKPAASFHYDDGDWLCRYCLGNTRPWSCLAFEYGRENAMDSHGSTAHVRDIKARRLDPKTKTMFYYETPKKYFFSK